MKGLLGIAIAICVTLSLIAIPLSGCAGPAPTTTTPTTPTPTATTPTPTTPTPTVEKPTYLWRMPGSTPLIEGDPRTDAINAFLKEVEDESDGRIVITYYPGSILGDYVYLLEQTSIGNIEIMNTTLATSMDPRLNITSMSYQVFDWEGAREAYGPGGWMREIFDGLAEDMNWKILGVSTDTFVGVASTIEFTPTPEAVKAAGLKARVMPKESDRTVAEALGFAPFAIPWSEVYTSLTSGIIEVCFGIPAYGMKYIADALQPTGYWYNYMYSCEAAWTLMNLDLWNSLSTEDQQIVQTAADHHMDFLWDYLPKEEQQFKDDMPTKWNVTHVELTPEQMVANVKAVRESQWPFMDGLVGTALMDEIRANTPGE